MSRQRIVATGALVRWRNLQELMAASEVQLCEQAMHTAKSVEQAADVACQSVARSVAAAWSATSIDPGYMHALLYMQAAKSESLMSLRSKSEQAMERRDSALELHAASRNASHAARSRLEEMRRCERDSAEKRDFDYMADLCAAGVRPND